MPLWAAKPGVRRFVWLAYAPGEHGAAPMVDDRDMSMSSDEPVRGEGGAGAAQDELFDSSGFVVKRRLERSGRLVRTGGRFHANEFDLMVDGLYGGSLVSIMESDYVGFPEEVYLAATRVNFSDGTEWSIRAEHNAEPMGARTTRFGKVKQVPHGIHARVVVVSHGQHRLAWTDGILHRGRRGSSRVVAEGTSYELSPTRRANKGKITGSGVMRRSDPPWGSWSFTATAALPLSVVLLHWHLLIGDWQKIVPARSVEGAW